MTVKFYKYQGTGNDFILIDNRQYGLTANVSVIEKLCNRRFGIGADGLIFLQEKSKFDFEMVYFNRDGRESSMCGNGGRCIIQFAHDLGLIDNTCSFKAVDGSHEGKILSNGSVSLKMCDVLTISKLHNGIVMNTGSPHFVRFTENAKVVNTTEEARTIRYAEPYVSQGGINVNFVEKKNSNSIFVRTYERGVEDETLSCGTGVVASALATALNNDIDISSMNIETPGGHLQVTFTRNGEGFSNIFLIGSAVKVFDGTIEY